MPAAANPNPLICSSAVCWAKASCISDRVRPLAPLAAPGAAEDETGGGWLMTWGGGGGGRAAAS